MNLSVSLRPVLSSVGLGAFCVAADYVVFKRDDVWQGMRHGPLVKALLDNAAHALIGGWSWVNVVLQSGEPFSTLKIVQVAFCVCMASAIDLDHLIEARSFSLEVSCASEKATFMLRILSQLHHIIL